ncbi:MAG: MotA/TolQ/ExbB proton channel family protein [Spirochaetales bacterium]|nr:MotA/TolQ/ExbB proton channel family protein [Spirochaetales bacterium]
MKKSYILSLIVLIATMLFAMICSGCVSCFLDIGSLFMVIIPTFFMLIANYSLNEIGSSFVEGFRKEQIDSTRLKTGIIFFKSMQKYLIFSGMLGVFTGVIAMLAMLDNPEKFGAGLALALLTVLYSLFFSMAVAIPFRTGLEKRLAEFESGV